MPSDMFAAGVNERAHEMLCDLVGPRFSDTALRIATDWLKQEARFAIRNLTPTASEATAIGAGKDERRLSMARDQLTSALNLRGSGVPAGRWGWAMDHGVWLLKLAEQALSASPKVASDTAPGVREAVEACARWLDEISTNCDITEIVADGGITAGMVVQQEAREQRRRLLAALAASPTASDTDTAIPAGEVRPEAAEWVKHNGWQLTADGKADPVAIAGFEWADSTSVGRGSGAFGYFVRAYVAGYHSAAKPIAGMEAGEVEVKGYYKGRRDAASAIASWANSIVDRADERLATDQEYEPFVGSRTLYETPLSNEVSEHAKQEMLDAFAALNGGSDVHG